MKREELIHITLIFNLRQKHYLNEHDHHMVTLYLYTLSLINIWYKKSTKPNTNTFINKKINNLQINI